MSDEAKWLLKHLLIDNPEVDERVESGIEQNRKGWGAIILQDQDGKPVKSASVSMKQVKHDFHFGCNAFLLDQFPEEEKNAQYRELFSDLFNLATVPFYWRDLEPEEGNLRFDKNSRPIYRRPPPDLVLDFCEEHNITPKGHPLLWHLFRPDWLPLDEQSMRRHIHRRFREIGERYAHRIPIWDVCNEAQTLTNFEDYAHMPEDHVELAFDLAKRYFTDCRLTYNDDRIWYRYSKNYTPVYLLAKHLIDKGYRLDALGLQYHMFPRTIPRAAQNLNPVNLLACFDLYEKLNIPLNISEVTIAGRVDFGDGDLFQDIVTEKLFKLWFSHRAMNGIVWWNLVDLTASEAPLGDETAGENQHRGGLLNLDLSPKPAYNTLKRLIHEEWQTNPEFEYQEGAPNMFRGFYGLYDVTVKTSNGSSTHRVNFSRDTLKRFLLKV